MTIKHHVWRLRVPIREPLSLHIPLVLKGKVQENLVWSVMLASFFISLLHWAKSHRLIDNTLRHISVVADILNISCSHHYFSITEFSRLANLDGSNVMLSHICCFKKNQLYFSIVFSPVSFILYNKKFFPDITCSLKGLSVWKVRALAWEILTRLQWNWLHNFQRSNEMKVQGLLFKESQELQNGSSRALKHIQSPAEPGALCSWTESTQRSWSCFIEFPGAQRAWHSGCPLFRLHWRPSPVNAHAAPAGHRCLNVSLCHTDSKRWTPPLKLPPPAHSADFTEPSPGSEWVLCSCDLLNH